MLGDLKIDKCWQRTYFVGCKVGSLEGKAEGTLVGCGNVGAAVVGT